MYENQGFGAIRLSLGFFLFVVLTKQKNLQKKGLQILNHKLESILAAARQAVMIMILFAGTALVLISAAITDVRKGKIPNILVLFLAVFQTLYVLFSKFVLNTPSISGTLIFL